MANLVTIIRFPLLLIYILLMYFGGSKGILICTPLVLVIFLLDTVDGYIARIRGESSLLGSALDIATDRTVELVLWIMFADLKLIPVLLPLIAVVRGVVVDAIRTVGVSQGIAAFDQVKHPVSRFVVSSRFMRDFYGVAKGTAFVLLTLSLWMKVTQYNLYWIYYAVALIFAWVTIALNVIRGFPVLVQGYHLLNQPQAKK